MCGCDKQTKSIKHSLCFEEVKGRIISSLSLPKTADDEEEILPQHSGSQLHATNKLSPQQNETEV